MELTDARGGIGVKCRIDKVDGGDLKEMSISGRVTPAAAREYIRAFEIITGRTPVAYIRGGVGAWENNDGISVPMGEDAKIASMGRTFFVLHDEKTKRKGKVAPIGTSLGSIISHYKGVTESGEKCEIVLRAES